MYIRGSKQNFKFIFMLSTAKSLKTLASLLHLKFSSQRHFFTFTFKSHYKFHAQITLALFFNLNDQLV